MLFVHCLILIVCSAISLPACANDTASVSLANKEQELKEQQAALDIKLKALDAQLSDKTSAAGLEVVKTEEHKSVVSDSGPVVATSEALVVSKKAIETLAKTDVSAVAPQLSSVAHEQQQPVVDDKVKTLMMHAESVIQGRQEALDALRNDVEKLAERVKNLETKSLEVKTVEPVVPQSVAGQSHGALLLIQNALSYLAKSMMTWVVLPAKKLWENCRLSADK